MAEIRRSTLLALPDELLQHVLGYLDPAALASSAQTCRRLLQQSYDDLIWQPIVNSNLYEPIAAPTPLKSFRDLFVAHHPHWFLTRSRLWFADTEHMGKLILTHFEPSTGSIEAYAVTAKSRRGLLDWEPWEKDPQVRIISFDPQTSLDLHQPVLKLDVDSPPTQDVDENHSSVRSHAPSSVYSQEIMMETFQEAGLYASFMLCRALPEVAISESTKVWPPLRIPAVARTRNMTSSSYTSSGHRPTRSSDTSEHNFRLRKWVEYSGRRASPSVMSFASSVSVSAFGFGGPYFAAGLSSGSMGGLQLRMPEDITTYATIPESCYIPTPEKPWQGIWCGDYSGHGCEFLVIRQPDKEEEQPLPSGMDWLQQWFRGGRRGSTSSENSFASAQEEADDSAATMADVNEAMLPARTSQPPYDTTAPPDHYTDVPNAPSGRLEGIKLTGDANIPRGEYTFIAPDIGHGGFMRVADEEIFRGARIVRSAGHIAGRGFREGIATLALSVWCSRILLMPAQISTPRHSSSWCRMTASHSSGKASSTFPTFSVSIWTR